MKRVVRHVLPPVGTHRIVDIGCGTGANIGALAPYYDCLGVDPSEDAVASAQSRFPNVRFIRGQTPEVLITEGVTADMFLAMDVLEHVPDDFALFSGIVALMKPRSYLLVTVPAEESLWSPHDEAFGHLRRYDRKRLEDLWDGLPLTPRIVSYFNSRLYPAIKLIRFFASRYRRPFGHSGTDFSAPPALINYLLTRVFAGEQSALIRQFDGVKSAGYRRGVSLLALLERDEGAAPIRTKWSYVSADVSATR